MKKKLEADLISIAHRVLKLKGKEDVVLLHQEAQKLFEKLAILRFYEEHINVLKEEISEEDLEEKINAMDFSKAPIEVKVEAEVEEEPAFVKESEEETTLSIEEDEVETEQVEEKEEIQDLIEAEHIETEKEEPIFSPIFELSEEIEEEKPQAFTEQKQISFEDLLGSGYKEPEFVKVNEVPKEVEKVADIFFEKVEETVFPEIKIETKIETTVHKIEHKSISLNDTLIKGMNIGLNDRIAFVKHLFGGSNEDFNRVVSQISTYDSFEEVQQFIVDMVKPDYNNWHGKEDYADRFMNLIEKKFA
jgi:hypothetical protein